MVENCKMEWKNMPEKRKHPEIFRFRVLTGASDLTRTGDLLITSGGLAVLSRFA